MLALTQLHDGYSRDATGQQLRALEPYVELREIPVPVPTSGQVLVKVSRAAVNPSDIAFIKGIYGQARRKGIAAGFEGCGTVVAGDTPLIGKRVSFFGSGTGTWAEYALADASQLVPLRDDVSDDDAAGLIVNPVTAAAMFQLVQDAGAGSFVATAAASQLGKFLIALGKKEGLPCIAHVRRGEVAHVLKKRGAVDVIATDDADYALRLKEVMTAHAPTVMLDAVAGPASAEVFFAMPDGARWVCYGRLSSDPPALSEMAQLIFREKRIEGFWLTRWMKEARPEVVVRTLAKVQECFANGTWTTEISDTVELSQSMDRLPAAYGKKDSKVLIAP